MQRRVSAAELERVVPLDPGGPTTEAQVRPPHRPHPNSRPDAGHLLSRQRHSAARAQGARNSWLPLSRVRQARRAQPARRDAVGSRAGFQARASFRQSYRELVVAFGPLAKELISADRETIALNTVACWIDALAVLAPDFGTERASQRSRGAIVRGELLEELDGVSVVVRSLADGRAHAFAERLRALLEDELEQARGRQCRCAASAPRSRGG